MSESIINDIVERLELKAHPEGGYYREVYRSAEKIEKEALPGRFPGGRNFMTSIYFLLKDGYFSAFHRIKSDELWYFHKGADLIIHIINKDGSYTCCEMGMDKLLQCAIPEGSWFAAETAGQYSLVSCAVAPGFDFADFELAERDKLISEFPNHKELIHSFCRE